jgi:hypothetical protein
VVEKENFPIIKATDRLRHFPFSSNGFKLLIDNRNLVYVFNPWHLIQTSRNKTWTDYADWRQSRAHSASLSSMCLENIWVHILSRSKPKITAKVNSLRAPKTLVNPRLKRILPGQTSMTSELRKKNPYLMPKNLS